MEGKYKFYYLAETSGWDMSAYAFSYRPEIKNLDSYKILSVNIIACKNHRSTKAQELVKEYESLNLEPRTLKDTFILETKINYLALHSFPEFYINPLAIDPNYVGSLTTLGELYIDYKDGEKSINEIIAEEETPLAEKREAVEKKTNEWLEDMNELVYTSLEIVRKRAFSKKGRSAKKENFYSVMDILGILLANFLFLFQLLYPGEVYWNCFFSPDASYVLSYLSYLYPIFLFFFDLSYALFHSYSAKISEPYNYARRFLKKNADKVFDDIRLESDRLKDYLTGAINDRIPLRDDIRSFSKLSSSYVDFEEVFSVEKLRNSKMYRFLHASLNIIRTLTYLVGIFTLVCYILALTLDVPF